MKNFIFDRYGYYVENGEVFDYIKCPWPWEVNK